MFLIGQAIHLLYSLIGAHVHALLLYNDKDIFQCSITALLISYFTFLVRAVPIVNIMPLCSIFHSFLSMRDGPYV